MGETKEDCPVYRPEEYQEQKYSPEHIIYYQVSANELTVFVF